MRAADTIENAAGATAAVAACGTGNTVGRGGATASGDGVTGDAAMGGDGATATDVGPCHMGDGDAAGGGAAVVCTGVGLTGAGGGNEGIVEVSAGSTNGFGDIDAMVFTL